MAKVEYKSIQKNFGSTEVIKGFNLTVESGEFLALVGPSGCGKSTALRMLAGLESPTSGEIHIDNRNVTSVSPKDRGVSMVFQSYALYPHMTVAENICFPMKMSGVNANQRSSKLKEITDMLYLTELLDRKPSQLSGGQKQRVAMGRALAKNPKVLLFDEPLSNLDAQLRVKVRAEIAQLHKRIGATIIYVTHDQIEAMTLANRIAVFNAGKLEQVGKPLEVYHKPESQFVASFIGTPPMNFIAAKAAAISGLPQHAATMGFRPESTYLQGFGEESGLTSLGQGTVELIEPLGSLTHIHLKLGNGMVVAEIRGDRTPKLGDQLTVLTRAQTLFFFNQSGERIANGASL